MTEKWYALSCKPNKEETLLHQLRAQGFEVFFPRCLELTKKRNILKVKPLFPGYLFVRIDLEVVALSTFQRMEFTDGLARIDEKPAFVPDQLIHAIHSRIERAGISIGRQLSGTEFVGDSQQSGEPVPGYEAIFSKGLSDKERVQALLGMLNEAAPAEKVSALTC